MSGNISILEHFVLLIFFCNKTIWIKEAQLKVTFAWNFTKKRFLDKKCLYFSKASLDILIPKKEFLFVNPNFA